MILAWYIECGTMGNLRNLSLKHQAVLDPSCLFMLPANGSTQLAGEPSAVGTVVGSPIFCVGTVGTVIISD